MPAGIKDPLLLNLPPRAPVPSGIFLSIPQTNTTLRYHHYSKQECNAADAAVYVAAAMLEGSDKGQSCHDMSGKAKQDCLAQQQTLKESLEKHARK